MRRLSILCVLCLSFAAALATSATANAAVLIGDHTIESTLDSNSAGSAEAFPFSNSTAGTASSISVYIDSQNTARTLTAGLYSDSSGHPGALLASGSLAPKAGTWNTVSIASTAISAGGTYWVAVLGNSGTVYFRDRSGGPCNSESSYQTNLTSLASSWTSSVQWNTCPISAYVNGTGTATAAPVNMAVPAVSGTAMQGQSLSTSNGTWSNSPTSYAYQWQDCDSSGSNCMNVSGATSSSYTPTRGDVNHTMRALVAASNTGGSALATSAQTPLVSTPSPAAPVNTAVPAVSGTATQGQTLSTSNGTWSGSPTGYAYQWQDCNSSGASCTNVSGATSSSYTLTSGDVNHTVRAVVTASNAGGSTLATSAQTVVVFSPPPAAPVNTALPAVSGTATQGQTLNTSNGSWNGSPTSHAYAWQDCDSGGANCTNISGPSASSYTLTSGDVGHTIRSVVTATNAGGSTRASSAPTAVVSATTPPPAPSSSAAPVVSGTAQQGQTLTTSNGSWNGSPTSYAYAWQDCDISGGNCTTVSGATASSYTVTSNDVGHTTRSVVTATNRGGSTSASSAATGVVTAASTSGSVPCALTYAAGADGTNSCWATHTGVQGSTGCTEAQIKANTGPNCTYSTTPGAAKFTLYTGSLVATANTTYDHYWINGCVTVNQVASNVTIQDSLITDPSGGGTCKGDEADAQPSTINNGNSASGPTGLVVKDTTVDGENSTYAAAIGVQLNPGSCIRCNIFGYEHQAATAVDATSSTYRSLWQDTYVHNLSANASCSHENGFYFDGNFITVEHSWVRMNGTNCGVTAALSLQHNYYQQNNITIDNGFFDGGGGAGANGDLVLGCSASNVIVTNNALSTEGGYPLGYWLSTGTGNNFAGNYQITNSGTGPPPAAGATSFSDPGNVSC
jgi:hypothetical protein